MKPLLFLISIVIPSWAMAQNTVEAQFYQTTIGWRVNKGDTIWLNVPKQDGNYSFITRGDVSLNYQDAATYYIIKKIIKKKYQDYDEITLKVDGPGSYNYKIDIENAIYALEVKPPDGYVVGDKVPEFTDRGKSYLASNGIKYKVGDTVKLGLGSAPSGDFRYLEMGGWYQLVAYESNGGSSQFNANKGYAGFNAIVKDIKTRRLKGATKTIFTVGVGNITNYYLSIEEAILSCEVLPCKDRSATVQHINNVSPADELLKFKKLLDEGIITEQEFKEQKTKLLSK